MGEYTLNRKAVVQRSYAEGSRYGNMLEYLKAQMFNEDFDPEATVIGVTVPEASNILCLNAVAGFVLEATILGRDVEWICETLEDLFDADPAEISEDVKAILADMAAKGILA